ncbi:MerR family transcriptional regulator [Lentzea flaviverrucosa]|uniref:DNA-binding transcriptional regulator, MerR family n=1 Tax=Lentzea flaviverrucosa TaxID=200379 RepID=A0A1H9D5E4_9PSEU|nr:MerR family transcriptional regulator [Lentzea flaviverrucosa]RDI24753.1 DNA-binding transcriptional MerR regulator [Lentzea flaviverrucosa]SEQ08696.1 DNA-binding transcriptional regulator, MerR family [Lentzea flaviverrucosa]
MNDIRLYAIGEVARRTGLSVSAIRFYSDEGIVAPAEVTAAGHRLYDVHAIARLEFVSTLRELDAGLDDIRRLLEGRVTLSDLATAHLSRLDDQARRIRSRKAVLRTIARQHTEAEQVILMHKLVGMSDGERDRLFDDFWNEISEGLEVSPEFLGLMRNGRLVLPDEPSTEQLEAWIELANLLQDADFRREVKKALRETFSGPAAAMMTSAEMVGAFERGGAIFVRAQEAQQAGEPADSPRGREIAGLYAAHLGEITETPDSPEYREKLAADVMDIERLHLESIEEAATSTDPYIRYQSLVAIIDGTAQEAAEFMPFAWLSAALNASVSPERATHECPPHGDVPDARNP